MPHITVEMYPGRDEKIKLEIAEAVADTIANKLSMDKSVVSVSIKEVEKEKWKSQVYDRVLKDENKELYIKPGYKME